MSPILEIFGEDGPVNRTDRLYAITEELRRRGPAGSTGRRLAAMLEVSERTIKRDVSALQQAGTPIWAQSGPGGGYVLDAVATLPPLAFTPAQAVAVAVALAAMPAGSPFGVDAAVTRGKVWDALGPADRERAATLSARVWTHPPGDGEAPPVEPTVLRAVEQALGTGRVLAITHDVDGRVTRRDVEPILLAHAEGRWYLVAWCRTRQAVRWFRLSRIRRAHLTGERHAPRDVGEVGTPPTGAAPVG